MTVDLPPEDAPPPRILWVVLALALSVAIVAGSRGREVVPASVRPQTSDLTARVAGAALFARAGCADCHDPTGADSAVGPGLLGMAARAKTRIAQPEYGGEATTVEGYLEEAILDHCADRLPGYDCAGVPEVGLVLSMAEVAQLAAYLNELPSGAAP